MLFSLLPKSVRPLFVVIAAFLWSAPLAATEYRSNGYTFEVTPTPSWVEWAALPASQGSRVGQAVAYRLVDRQVHISDTGEGRFTRFVTQPLTEAGLHQAAEIEISFNPAFQTLKLHNLTLTRDGASMGRLRPEQVRLIQREEELKNKLYDGIVTAVIIIDDVRLRDSVDLSYSIVGRNPVFGNKHFSSFSLGWNVPVDKARVRVSTPQKRKLYTRAFNSDLKPEIRRANGRIDYLWEQTQTAAVFAEDDAPVWHQPFPAVQLTEYRRWRDVSGWADQLYTHGSELPQALQTQLQNWRKQEKDRKKLVARALKLVQDEVRYFGIEMGQNSHRPSPPAEVYERRYGDCKDKTTLLVAMLDQLGIKAWPALVSTDYQRDIDNWLPSPGMFDHVIVMTEVDGERYWLDGTRTYQNGSIDTLAVPDFELALVIRQGENRLTPIEVRETAASAIDIEEEFKVSDYQDAVHLEVTTTYSGAAAESMRQYFATNTPREITRSYLNYYAKLYPGVSSNGLVRFSDNPEKNRFTTLELYQVGNFWESGNDGLYASVLGSTILPYVKKPDTIRRAAPLAVSHPVNIRHASTIVYPEDVDYELDEPDVTYQDRFVEYQRSISYADRRLTVAHQYQSRNEAVMVERLEDYFATLGNIRNTLEYTTWISAAPQPSSIGNKVSNLLQRLDALSSR